jgi:hypothetical protein
MRGRIWLAAILGFFESLFWVSAAAIVFPSSTTDPHRRAHDAREPCSGLRRAVAGVETALLRVITSVESPSVAEALRRRLLGHGAQRRGS